MMRIAFCVGRFPVKSETFVLGHVNSLIAMGHDVTVYCGELTNEVEEHYFAGAKMVALRPNYANKTRGRQLILLMLALLSALCSPLCWSRLLKSLPVIFHGVFFPVADVIFTRQLKPDSFDVVVAHFGQAGVRAMFLRQAGIISGPIVTIFHGADISRKSVLAKFQSLYIELIRKTEHILCVNSLWRDRLLAWGAPASKVGVLRMGIDLGKVEMQNPATPLNRPMKVVSVGRFTEKKGLRYAIEAVKQSKARLEYTIIGYGPLEPELRALSLDDGSNKIKFVGKLNHAEVFDELRGADVFLLPSVTAADGDMEGIPVSIMEAMAIGTIVISTIHSGIPELVQHNLSGLLAEERNAPQLTAHLNSLAAGNIDIVSMRRAARKKVEEEYDNKILMAQLVEILSRLSTSSSAFGRVR